MYHDQMGFLPGMEGSFTLPYVKYMTSESSMHEAGHPKLVL